MALHIIANTTYFDPLPNEREMEEQTFQKEYTDKELKRTNPKRHDERTDWTEMNNEKGHDSDVSNRYSSVPVSVILYKIEKLCESPTRLEFRALRRLISLSSHAIKTIVYDYTHEQLQLVNWNREHLSKTSSTDLARRYFILQKLFE